MSKFDYGLIWSGNVKAQVEADLAYSKLKDKKPKSARKPSKKNPKKRRGFPKKFLLPPSIPVTSPASPFYKMPPPTDPGGLAPWEEGALDREFQAIVGR